MELFIELGSTTEDETEIAQLTGDLREALEGIDVVERADFPPSATQDRSKGAGLEWAQLLVEVAGALPPLVAVMRNWRTRNPDTSVRMRIDEDELILESPSDSEQDELVKQWLARHPAPS